MSKNLFEQAKSAKSAEELMSIAKTAGVDMGEENAKQLFGRLHQSGELADEELDSVAGGGCKSEEVDIYQGRRFKPIACPIYSPRQCSCGCTTFIVESSGSWDFEGAYKGSIILTARCEQCGKTNPFVLKEEVIFID